ncbi:hypothetical protein J6590_013106 [Homalodisca vitripennis]|nr:hypothetical protein J6590_013106 [Homalodisca vitripennis]
MSANRATENSTTDDEASDVDSESSGNTAVDSSGSDSEDIVNQDFVLSIVLTYITEASSKSHALKTL